MLLEYLGTSGGRQSACKSRGTTHPADFVCENSQKTGYCSHVLPEKTWSAYDLTSITAVWFLHLRVGLPLDLLQTFAEVVLVGLAVGVIAVLIEKKILNWRVSFLASLLKLLQFCVASAIIKSVEPSNASHKETTWESQLVFNTVTAESINLIKAQEKIQSKSLTLLDLWESAQEFNNLAQRFETVGRELENKWSSLSIDERSELQKIAYDLADKYCNEDDDGEKGQLLKEFFAQPISSLKSLIGGIFNVISLLREYERRSSNIISDYKMARNRLKEARYQFIDTILNAVECDNPQYEQFLSDTLKELSSVEESDADSLPGRVLKPGETREWLRNLSNKNLRKI